MSRSRHSKPKPGYLHGCWHCESPSCHHKSHREQRQTPLAEAPPAEEAVRRAIDGEARRIALTDALNSLDDDDEGER